VVVFLFKLTCLLLIPKLSSVAPVLPMVAKSICCMVVTVVLGLKEMFLMSYYQLPFLVASICY
jgi:hypothetical protein